MEHVTRIPATGDIDLDRAQTARILALHADGGRRPLVFARIWRGDEIQGYRDLALEWGPGQPVYLIGPPAAANTLDYRASAPLWAQHVLSELGALRLGGPPVLGGWSFGGVIALEAARELESSEKPVERVLMIDSWLPRKHSKQPRSFPRKAIELYEAWRSREPGDRWGALRGPLLWRAERWKRGVARRLWPGRVEVGNDDGVEGIQDPLRRCVWVAYLKYDPRPTTTPVTLCWCEDSRSDWGESTLGWAPWLRGPLHSVPVPGGHFTIWKHPGALAQALLALK